MKSPVRYMEESCTLFQRNGVYGEAHALFPGVRNSIPDVFLFVGKNGGKAAF